MSSPSPRSGTASRNTSSDCSVEGVVGPIWASARTSRRVTCTAQGNGRRIRMPKARACGTSIPPIVTTMTQPGVSEVQVRVNYSEVDAMGVAYHARYLVWLDIARTDHLRQAGMSYKELETAGYRLVVGDLHVRYRQPAHYDDPVRLRCWVREVGSRRVAFGYAV